MRLSILFLILGFYTLMSEAKTNTHLNEPIEFTRAEFGDQHKEGVILVKQNAHGKPAYTASYFVNGKVISTRVLIENYYLNLVQETLNLKKIKTRIPATSDCMQAATLTSKSERNAKLSQTKICLENQSPKEKEIFAKWAKHMKQMTLERSL